MNQGSTIAAMSGTPISGRSRMSQRALRSTMPRLSTVRPATITTIGPLTRMPRPSPIQKPSAASSGGGAARSDR